VFGPAASRDVMLSRHLIWAEHARAAGPGIDRPRAIALYDAPVPGGTSHEVARMEDLMSTNRNGAEVISIC
jgi:hypothetical protein